MRRSGRGLAASLSALLLAPLAACGSASQQGDQAGPLITIDDDWNAYPTAAITGTLREENGCLLIRGQVVFWPKGTRWDAEERAVVQTDGTTVAVGQRFDGGGGSYDPGTDFGDLLGSPDAAERIATCVESSSAEAVLVVTPS